MPILDVCVVGGDTPSREVVASVADNAAAALGAPPHGTWVRLSVLPEGCYAEGGGGPPPGVRPVFVTVLRADVPEGEAMDHEVRRLAAAVARALDRPPENVHVLYEPSARGRAFFGGAARR